MSAAAGMVVALLVARPVATVAGFPLVVLTGLAATGSWKLWTYHRLDALQRRCDDPAAVVLPLRQLDDECELATFASLQEATGYVATARELLGTDPADEALLVLCARLQDDLDAFVFSGDGLGDLASAWALEDAGRELAQLVISRRRGRAA